jgi:hypothetical protein
MLVTQAGLDPAASEHTIREMEHNLGFLAARKMQQIQTKGDADQVPASARASIRDGLQGANHSHGPRHGEDLQRRRPPEARMREPRGT